MAGAPLPKARDIDILYQESDRLYYRLARDCGISATAYWILYDIVVAGGSTPQRAIAEAHSMSKQTVNSAIKSLEGRGLVTVGLEEGSRRAKVVALTEAGRAFCDEKVAPAIEAEDRAFASLTESDRRELVRLVSAYVGAIRLEVSRMAGAEAPTEGEVRS